MAAVMTGRPFQMVASQAKTWTMVKIEIVMLAALKKLIARCRHADGEHVVHPHAESDHAGQHRRQRRHRDSRRSAAARRPE